MRVLKLQPDNALAYGLLGDVYGQLNVPSEATDAYMQAFRLDPTQVQLYLALTNQFRQQGGKQDDVLELLQTAVRANPDEAALALALGDQYQQRGDTEAAIDAYQAALDKFERSPTVNRQSMHAPTNTGRAFAFVRLAAVSEDRGHVGAGHELLQRSGSGGTRRAVDPGDLWRCAPTPETTPTARRLPISARSRTTPTYATAYVRLADLLEAQGNRTAADALLDEALAITLEQTSTAAVAKGYAGLGKLTPDCRRRLQL